MDLKKIEDATRLLLEAVGDNPNREGLKDTPRRVAKYYQEVLEGMKYTNDDLVKMFTKDFEHEASDNLVAVCNIPIYSFCEHHLALMYDMKVSIAYIPKGRVIGLSKLPRIADMCAKRLQLQEKIMTDIAYVVQEIIQTNNVAVVVEGKHACVSTRGIKKDCVTRTSSLSGRFLTDPSLKKEFYDLIKESK